MKRVLFTLAFAFGCALAVGGCGSDGPVPLSDVEYTAQGNAICAQLVDDLAAIEQKAVPDLADDELLELSTQASVVANDAIEELFALVPPSSRVAERQILLDLTDERIEFITQLQNGEDVVADIQRVSEQFETQATRMWPSCDRP